MCAARTTTPGDAGSLNDALTHSGFRRSQMIAYRPACDGCAACVSVRVVASEFRAGRTMRRIDRLNADLIRTVVPPEAVGLATVTETALDVP